MAEEQRSSHGHRRGSDRWRPLVRGEGIEYDAFWRALYEADADVVLSSDDHDYERFAPQTPDAKPDPRRGIRQFVVGTGGNNLHRFGKAEPNSEVRKSEFGVLLLTLHARGYE